jgi:hypothetical protein
MKKLAQVTAPRTRLGKISTSTLGGFKGVIEVAGLYTPAIDLS